MHIVRSCVFTQPPILRSSPLQRWVAEAPMKQIHSVQKRVAMFGMMITCMLMVQSAISQTCNMAIISDPQSPR